MLMQDVRYAFRSLLKNPGFTAIAVACLALGIGVNATIFSVVDGVILQAVPLSGRRTGSSSFTRRTRKKRVRRAGLSYADYKDLRDSNATIASLAAFTERSLTIADPSGEPERYRVPRSAGTCFTFSARRPSGRNFAPDDDRPGAEPVVLLSYDVWERRYQKDPAIIGRAINVNGRPHTVIGVMPPNASCFPRTSDCGCRSRRTRTPRRATSGEPPGVRPAEARRHAAAGRRRSPGARRPARRHLSRRERELGRWSRARSASGCCPTTSSS